MNRKEKKPKLCKSRNFYLKKTNLKNDREIDSAINGYCFPGGYVKKCLLTIDKQNILQIKKCMPKGVGEMCYL